MSEILPNLSSLKENIFPVITRDLTIGEIRALSWPSTIPHYKARANRQAMEKGRKVSFLTIKRVPGEEPPL